MNELQWEFQASLEMATILEQATTQEQFELMSLITRMEQELLADPLTVGESRSGSDRIGFFPPLVIGFEVSGNRIRIYRVVRSRR